MRVRPPRSLCAQHFKNAIDGGEQILHITEGNYPSRSMMVTFA